MTTVTYNKKADALYQLSLFWLRPTESLWDEITAPEALDDLSQSLKEGFDIDINAQELADSLPSFEEARKLNFNKLSLTFGKQAAAPIESLYKEWTQDPTCKLPNARETGSVMGDPAYHVRDLLNTLEIQLPEDFYEMPDHLSVLLNLAGILAESGNQDAYSTFVCDHLDWLGDYQDKLSGVAPESFYNQFVDIINRIHDVECPDCSVL